MAIREENQPMTLEAGAGTVLEVMQLRIVIAPSSCRIELSNTQEPSPEYLFNNDSMSGDYERPVFMRRKLAYQDCCLHIYLAFALIIWWEADI